LYQPTGAETTAKLIKMKVLIVGLRGIGIETAKNLALQGAGAITVGSRDPQIFQLSMYSSSFTQEAFILHFL
jgi:molybdopterin/thiamine biosynthesis adenylyltransferase